MLVMMKSHATADEISAVCRKIELMGFKAHPIPGITRTAIGITGNQGPVEAAALEALPESVNAYRSRNRTSWSDVKSKRPPPLLISEMACG